MVLANISFSNDYHSSMDCLYFGASSFIYITVIISNIVILLPLFSFILYYGLQNWLQTRSTSSASTISHLDSFTYHMVTMEMIGISRCFLNIMSVFMKNLNLIAGFVVFAVTWYGQGLFHILTCVERYLAVVHPVIYLSLRSERGTRMRNISIGCAWLLSVSSVSLSFIESVYNFYGIAYLTLFLAAIIFCCLSVIRVLIRPGPGERGRQKVKVDKSKQRAFYTIVAILGVLVLKFSWALVWIIVSVSRGGVECWMIVMELLVNLPSSLVLPLLFLHRKKKLMCKTGIQ